MTALSSNPDALAELDDYQIVREIGRGGMGVVYEAIETKLPRRVALKVLPQAAAFDARQLARFQNEALSAAQLDHAHIVPLYRVGCKNGIHFYAMKYIDGRSLAEIIDALQHARLDRGILGKICPAGPATQLSADAETLPGTNSSRTIGDAPWQDPSSLDFFHMTARWGIQAAEALHHAHSSGITHGDVKPANLLIDAHGNLWLTDFGLARSNFELQRAGTLSPGTPRYLSPEQARADAESDHRTDIYSLGATLYELVALEPANPGTMSAEILDRIAFGTVAPPSEHNPNIPAELQAILCRALAGNAADRYSTARELAQDLERFVCGKQVCATPSVPSQHTRRRWLPRPAVLLTAALLTVFIALPLCTLFPSLPRRHAPVQRSPAQEAAKRLRAIQLQDIDRLSKAYARGEKPSSEDRRLLENGPEIYQPALDPGLDGVSNRLLLGEQYPFELSYVFYRLAEIHRRLDNRELQGRMVRTSIELMEKLASRKLKEYRLPLAFLSMTEAECHAAAERHEEARVLGTRIIETLDIARKANDPEKPDDQIMAAFLHTRFGRMLAGALPAQDVQRHHRIAIDVLERLEQITPPRFAIPFFPYESPQELLAECRVNLASSLRPSEEGKANLELAIEFLDDQTGTAVEEIEWRTNLLAQAERDLGAVLNQLGQPDDARRHLRRSIAVFEDLLAEWPAVVEYQLNLAIAKSTLDSITNAPSHVTK